ncbi:hypothetical protein H5410_005780 [Solanum commersonii]|uniref:Uncharacterized protein n=1 Tax=Solanum commersonii TaxID=4109 RepID=A0A9J6A8D8_SOLCO|nr:hypothetical protein H5410_005780 [Solanum commersonii]
MVPLRSHSGPSILSLTLRWDIMLVPSRGIPKAEVILWLAKYIQNGGVGMGRRPRFGHLEGDINFYGQVLLVTGTRVPIASWTVLVHPTKRLDIGLIRDEANVAKTSREPRLRDILPPCPPKRNDDGSHREGDENDKSDKESEGDENGKSDKKSEGDEE